MVINWEHLTMEGFNMESMFLGEPKLFVAYSTVDICLRSYSQFS